MKYKMIRLLFYSILAITISGCTKESTGRVSDNDKVAVQFQTAIATRAHDGVWDENDAIGLAMLVHGGTEIVNDVFNYHYVYSDPSSGGFIPASNFNTIYFPQDGSPVTFRAYYPYYPNLDKNMIIPISTADQTVLPRIDLMSADHVQGFEKSQPQAHLVFHHRLSKVIFILDDENTDPIIPIEDLTLTIKGMETEAMYHLLEEYLDSDARSKQNIVIPQREDASNRYGIVLPRPAGEGVTFVFEDAKGNSFTARMDETLDLESGYQYTFRIALNGTEVSISAEIEPWLDGPVTYYDALQVSIAAGQSHGVEVGDRMNVYINGDGQYSLLEVYTYNSEGRWIPDSPVYWENIDMAQADLRASIIAAQALNTTQLPDILIADDLRVSANTGANFVFRHAASKATVMLQSNTFSPTDLNNATIILPNYVTGGGEQNGEFVEGSTARNITLEQVEGEGWVGIFQSQTIPAGGDILTIRLNGRDYTAKAEDAQHIFNPGEAQLIIVSLDKEDLTVSVTVVDWTPAEYNLNAVTIGTVAGATEGVNNGEVMTVYTGTTDERSELNKYTYNLAEDKWTGQNTIYWESLPEQVRFYASILREQRYNDTQIDDYLVADPVVVNASNGVNFTLSHPAARVVVQLTSNDGSFSDLELSEMELTLPNYDTGATVVNGIFIPGNTVGNITIQKGVGANNSSAMAFIQPQSVAAGDNVIVVDNPNGGNPRQYTAKYTQNITYAAGVSTLLTIDMSKTEVTVSANVVDWEEGAMIDLVSQGIVVGGSLDGNSDFFEGKPIYIYQLGQTTDTYVYSYLNTGQGYSWRGERIYWDDQPGLAIDLAAVHYPYNGLVPTLGPSDDSFPWTINTDQTGGYADYDLLMAYRSLPEPLYVNFLFTHVLSKARIELVSDEFSQAELRGAQVTLNNFYMSGTADLRMAAISSLSGSPQSVIPYTGVNGQAYSALVMPQTIAGGTNIVTVKLSDYPDSNFTGTLQGSGLEFVAGYENVIRITLRRTGIELNATLKDWEDGETGYVTID